MSEPTVDLRGVLATLHDTSAEVERRLAMDPAARMALDRPTVVIDPADIDALPEVERRDAWRLAVSISQRCRAARIRFGILMPPPVTDAQRAVSGGEMVERPFRPRWLRAEFEVRSAGSEYEQVNVTLDGLSADQATELAQMLARWAEQ